MKKKKKQTQFVKFNARDFIPNSKTIKMNNGGRLVGNTMQGVQAGMMFGPWGAAIGGAVGLGAGLIQNGVEKDQRYKSAIASNAQGPNPYGNLQFKMGGKRWTYEKGGFVEFNGPKHAQGGIPYKGVEVEGGETEVSVDGSPYILSDRIVNPGTGNSVAKDSKRINRVLKGRNDAISNKTREISNKQLSNINESFKGIQSFMESVSQPDAMAYGGKRKMQLGGPGEPPTKTNYPPNMYVDPLQGLNINTINNSALQNTPTAMFQQQKSSIDPSSNGFLNPYSRQSPNNSIVSQYGSSGSAGQPGPFNPNMFIGPKTLPPNTNNYLPPSMFQNGNGDGLKVPTPLPMISGNNNSNTVASGNQNGIFSNLTTGDKVQMVSQFAPAAINLGRGLFEKAEQVSPDYNEYNDTMRGRAAGMNIDFQALINERRLSTNALNNAIRGGTTSSSVARSNLQQSFANEGLDAANIKLKEQQAQNQLDMYRNQLDSQIGNRKSNQRERARIETAANKSRKNDMISKGFEDLGAAGQDVGRGLNAGLFNERSFQALQALYPNFTMNDYQEFIKSGKNFTDFIKFKGY